MSINRHHCGERSARQDRVSILRFFPDKWPQRGVFWGLFGLLVGVGIFVGPCLRGFGQFGDGGGLGSSRGGVLGSADSAGADADAAEAREAEAGKAEAQEKSERVGNAIADRVLEYLTWGPPLEAKLRLRAWAAGREVVEVGTYQQAGLGSGRLLMSLQVPIAEGTARWQQVCDGRLAWTREELAGEVRVRRVDLGRLDELLTVQSTGMVVRGEVEPGASRVTPRLRVGGLAEIVDRIRADYRLSVSEGHIAELTPDGESQKVSMLVIKGEMRQSVVAAMREAGGGAVSSLVPQQVRIAIRADSLAEPLPSRIEFWSHANGRLVSLLEIYDVTQIEPPPIERFRFEAGGDDFVNETELYLRRFSSGLASRTAGSNRAADSGLR